MAGENWAISSPQTIDVDGVTSLKLGMVRGRFDVITHAEPVVRLEFSEVHGDPVAVSLNGGRLEVRHQLHGASKAPTHQRTRHLCSHVFSQGQLKIPVHIGYHQL